jgi:parvulin-like peptidyl-prolyl isomerase
MGGMLALKKPHRKSVIWMLLLILIISACSATPTEVVQTETNVAVTESPTPEQPTPTLIPAAAIVNGVPLPLSWYENELSQYISSQEILGQPVEDMDAARELVLEDLIDQFLLAQAALDAGIIIEDEEVQGRIENLREELDLDAWMMAWGYTQESLGQSLRWQMLAIAQRNIILDAVPEIAEQVELQQVFAYTETGARNAVAGLNAGRAFEEVAFEFDPVTGGYLGWVPQGYLLIPELEQVAFTLAMGDHSAIIESEIGYHIVKVLAREERPLSSDARLTLQREALHTWLAEKREGSQIEVLID